MAGAKRPDALFVNHDLLTQGVLMAIYEVGLKIPADLGLLTHYNEGVNIASPIPLTKLVYYPGGMVDVALEAIRGPSGCGEGPARRSGL